VDCPIESADLEDYLSFHHNYGKSVRAQVHAAVRRLHNVLGKEALQITEDLPL